MLAYLQGQWVRPLLQGKVLKGRSALCFSYHEEVEDSFREVF